MERLGLNGLRVVGEKLECIRGMDREQLSEVASRSVLRLEAEYMGAQLGKMPLNVEAGGG